MLVCLPFLGWLFGIINWILDNIGWIFITVIVIIITSILVWFALDDEKEVQEEEENV
jgi:plastocyanin domain-containing protein